MPKGTKKPKDKNAPKRPQSSYFVYSNERRVELKRVNPEKKVTEISKMIAAEWNKKDEAGKKPYEEKAKEKKEQYEKDLKEYKKTDHYTEYQDKLKSWKENTDGETKTRGKRSKRAKDPNAPKKPQTAYFIFSSERRPQLKTLHPEKKITELAKLLGDEWKEKDESEKKTYQDKAKSEKEDYDKKFEEYKKTDQYTEFQAKIKNEKKKPVRKNTKQLSEDESDENTNGNSGEDSDDGEKTKGKGSKNKGDEEEGEVDSTSESASEKK